MSEIDIKPNKVYNLSDGSRATFVILGIILVSASVFLLNFSFENLEFSFKLESFIAFFGGLLCLSLVYKGIKKIYTLIKYNVPILELYDTFLVVALYPGGKYSSVYKGLFGKYSYFKINFTDIESIYRNKKFIRTDYSRVQGYTFITGIINEQKFDIPTLIGSIGSSNYINLKIRLNQVDFDVSKMI